MGIPGITTRDYEKKSVQAFTAATAPRAAEYGPFPALIDGVTYLSDGESADSFPSGWSIASSPKQDFTQSPALVAMFGDSIGAGHQTNLDVFSWVISGGTATLTTNTVSSVVTSGHIVFIAGTGIPESFKGYKILTAVGTASVSFAVGDPDGSGSVTFGRCKLWGVSNSTSGIGGGKAMRGFLHWANVVSGNTITMPCSYNWSSSGDVYVHATLQQGLRYRLEANWSTLPVPPKMAIFQMGTNDVNEVSNGVKTLQAVKDAAVWCWDYARSKGAIVAVWKVCAATTLVGTNYNRVAAEWNEWLDRYALENGNIVVFDGTTRYNDPNSATGAARSGFTTDGLHPIPKGGKEIGLAIAPVLSKMFQPVSARPYSMMDAYDATYNPHGCVINGKSAGLALFTTTGADTPVTGTNLAGGQTVGGWTFYKSGAGTISAAVSARTDTFPDGQTIPGNEAVITFTGCAITDFVTMELPSANWLTTLIANGDKIFIEFAWAWTDLSGITNIKGAPTAQVTMFDGVNQFTLHTGNVESSADTNPTAMSGVARSQIYHIQRFTSGTARASVVTFAPAGTSAKLRIKYVTVRKVNDSPLPW